MSDGAGLAEASRVLVHANALLIGSIGLLLRGPSGAGKSGLSRELIALAAARGQFARLVGDDRVELSNRGGRLVARPHPAIAGAIEERGRGVRPIPHEPAAVMRCLVELRGPGESPPPRFPEEADATAELCGVTLPRLRTAALEPGAARRILSFIHEVVAI